MRLSYLPPLMVYLAAGVSGLTGVIIMQKKYVIYGVVVLSFLTTLHLVTDQENKNLKPELNVSKNANLNEEIVQVDLESRLSAKNIIRKDINWLREFDA